jgi:hypothetical protein
MNSAIKLAATSLLAIFIAMPLRSQGIEISDGTGKIRNGDHHWPEIIQNIK